MINAPNLDLEGVEDGAGDVVESGSLSTKLSGVFKGPSAMLYTRFVRGADGNVSMTMRSAYNEQMNLLAIPKASKKPVLDKHAGPLTAVVKAATRRNGATMGNGIKLATEKFADHLGLQPVMVDVKTFPVKPIVERVGQPIFFADNFTEKAAHANEYALACADFMLCADSFMDKSIEGVRARKEEWAEHSSVHPQPPRPLPGSSALLGFEQGDAERYRADHPEQWLLPSFHQMTDADRESGLTYVESVRARIAKLNKEPELGKLQVVRFDALNTVGAAGRKNREKMAQTLNGGSNNEQTVYVTQEEAMPANERRAGHVLNAKFFTVASNVTRELNLLTAAYENVVDGPIAIAQTKVSDEKEWLRTNASNATALDIKYAQQALVQVNLLFSDNVCRDMRSKAVGTTYDECVGTVKSDLETLRKLHDNGLVLDESNDIWDIQPNVSYVTAQSVMIDQVRACKEKLVLLYNQFFSRYMVGDEVTVRANIDRSVVNNRAVRGGSFLAKIERVLGPDEYKIAYNDGDKEGIVQGDTDGTKHGYSDPVKGGPDRITSTAEAVGNRFSFAAALEGLAGNLTKGRNAVIKKLQRHTKGADPMPALPEVVDPIALVPMVRNEQPVVPNEQEQPNAGLNGQGNTVRKRQRANVRDENNWNKTDYEMPKTFTVATKVVGSLVKHWNESRLGTIINVVVNEQIELTWLSDGVKLVVSDKATNGKKSSFETNYRHVAKKIVS